MFNRLSFKILIYHKFYITIKKIYIFFCKIYFFGFNLIWQQLKFDNTFIPFISSFSQIYLLDGAEHRLRRVLISSIARSKLPFFFDEASPDTIATQKTWILRMYIFLYNIISENIYCGKIHAC